MTSIETIQSFNQLLAWGGLVGILATVGLVIDMRGKRLLGGFVRIWGLHIAFLAALFSAVFTLVYSEIFGIIPCGLCWFERMMLYPQILITISALYFKEKGAALYGIILSVTGLIISLYHHYLQMGGSAFIKCPAAGTVDCAKRFMFEFGFMTFPLMAAILFAFLIVLYVYIRREEKLS